MFWTGSRRGKGKFQSGFIMDIKESIPSDEFLLRVSENKGPDQLKFMAGMITSISV